MTLPAPQRFDTREEWLGARRLGSSDVAPVLGVSVYDPASEFHKTAWHVWEAKLGLAPAERYDDQVHARRGQRREPQVLDAYERLLGERLHRPRGFELYRREGWATSTPDALRPRARRSVEAKTDRRRERWGPAQRIDRWEPGCEAIVRPDHYLQAMHQVWTLDLEGADLVVLLPPDPDGDDPFANELRVYELDRDDELLARMIPRLRTWWDEHVVRRVPPPFDGSDPAMRHLARRDRDGRREATPRERELAARFLELQQATKAAEAERRGIGAELVLLAGDAKHLELPAGHVTVVRKTGAPRLDEGALLANHPELGELLERYRRPGHPSIYPLVVPGKGV